MFRLLGLVGFDVLPEELEWIFRRCLTSSRSPCAGRERRSRRGTGARARPWARRRGRGLRGGLRGGLPSAAARPRERASFQRAALRERVLQRPRALPRGRALGRGPRPGGPSAAGPRGRGLLRGRLLGGRGLLRGGLLGGRGLSGGLLRVGWVGVSARRRYRRRKANDRDDARYRAREGKRSRERTSAGASAGGSSSAMFERVRCACAWMSLPTSRPFWKTRPRRSVPLPFPWAMPEGEIDDG